jgi:hypothetical protein
MQTMLRLLSFALQKIADLHTIRTMVAKPFTLTVLEIPGYCQPCFGNYEM